MKAVPKVDLTDPSVEPTDEELHALMLAVQESVIARKKAALAAAEAMESAGVESRQARAIAAQLHVAASTGEAVTRPELEASLAGLKSELLDRIAQSERGLVGREAAAVAAPRPRAVPEAHS